MFYDKENRQFKLVNIHHLKMDWVKQVFKTSSPVVVQSVLGIGSWFVFFSLIENIGERELEISNILRNLYLILSIPCWGLSAGINTMVSNFIGMKKRQAVLPLIFKTAKLDFLITLMITLPIVVFPNFFLTLLFGQGDPSLLLETDPLLPVLLVVLLVFSVGAIYMNGLMGTGYTNVGLLIQIAGTVVYVVYVFVALKMNYWGLGWAWASEIVYWAFMLIVCIIYLRSRKWFIRGF